MPHAIKLNPEQIDEKGNQEKEESTKEVKPPITLQLGFFIAALPLHRVLDLLDDQKQREEVRKQSPAFSYPSPHT